MRRYDADTVLARVADVDLSREELSTRAGLIVSFVDGVSNLELIATRTGLDLDLALREAEALVARGLLEEPAGPEPAEDDPSELDEEVDLDRARRRLVVETYRSLDRRSYYELLEVHPDADRKAIQKAYFRLSKLFHPDTLYGKNLGSYRKKMEAIFQRMTKAYEVLGRSKRRAEYDEKLGAAYLTRLRGAMMAMSDTEPPPPASSGAERDAARSAAGGATAPRPSARPTPRPSARPTPRPSSLPTPRPSVAPPRSSLPPGGDAERRRRLAAARLSGVFGGPRGRGARMTSAPAPRTVRPSPPNEEGAPSGDRRALAEKLAQSVQRSSELTGNNPRLTSMLAAAATAEREGRYEEALMHLGGAKREAPERSDVEASIARVRRAMTASNVDRHRERAAAYRRVGRLKEAALAFRDVTEGAPDDVEAHVAAAECLMEMSPPDLRAARDHARRAVEIDPARLRSHLLLAEVYLRAGMTHNAIRALEGAEAIDGRSPEVERFRQRLGG